MVLYMIDISEFTKTRNCYLSARTQLNTIRDTIERIAHKNDRLPLPTARNIGSDSPYDGREVTPSQIAASAIDHGVSWGALLRQRCLQGLAAARYYLVRAVRPYPAVWHPNDHETSLTADKHHA